MAPKEQCPVNKANTSQLQVNLITMRPRDNCFIIPGCGKVRNLFKLVKVQTWFMALGRSVAWECPFLALPGQARLPLPLEMKDWRQLLVLHNKFVVLTVAVQVDSRVPRRSNKNR